MIIDKVNSLFEGVASIFLFLNLLKTLKDKEVKGLSLISMFFFLTWACWNVFYLFQLTQIFSFCASVLYASLNIIWVVLAMRYRKK